MKKKISGFGVTLVAMLGVSMFSMADSAGAANVMNAAPLGFERYLVYMQNGEFDPFSPNPDVPGCFQFFCDGDYFQQEIMGRTPAEAAQQEVRAKAFFLDRYGIDVDDPALVGRVFFRSFLQDPRVNSRAYVMSGTRVPTEGYEVRDGGHILFFLDPAGVPLSAEFAGETAPAGTFLVFGEYNIDTSRGNGNGNAHGNPHNETIISFRSGGLVSTNDVNGLTSFSCELARGRSDAIGFHDLSVPSEGRALGVVDQPIVLSNGDFRMSYRNQLTFNDQDGY